MGMQFYETRKHTARKDHKCECCREVIPAGSEYYTETGKWNDEFFTRKLHPICYKVLNAYFYDTNEDEFDWDDIEEYAEETFCSKCLYSIKHEDEENYIPCEAKSLFHCQIFQTIFEGGQK